MFSVSTKFQNNRSKTVRGVCDTKLPIFCTQPDRQTDRQTDMLILVYPETHSLCGGIKILSASETLYKTKFF